MSIPSREGGAGDDRDTDDTDDTDDSCNKAAPSQTNCYAALL